jgi:diguanylate cyclase (GGDEF)-like protein
MKGNDLFFDHFQKRTTFIATYLTIAILVVVLSAHILLVGNSGSIAIGITIILLLATLLLLRWNFKKWYNFLTLFDHFALIVLIDYIFLSGFNHYALIWFPSMAMSAYILGDRKNGTIITTILIFNILLLTYYSNIPPRDIVSIVLAIGGSALLGAVIKKGFDEFKAENERIRKRLYVDANIDPLTKLYNRRYFTHEANKLLALATRKQQPFGILSIDIDHFKKINDTYGHDFGDVILKKFAHSLLKGVRGYDLAARIGGEEFVVAIIGENRPTLAAIAHRIKTEAAKIRYGDDKRLTVSIGIHSEIPTQDTTLEEMLKKSDEALYLAKNRGRNRIEFYEKSD